MFLQQLQTSSDFAAWLSRGKVKITNLGKKMIFKNIAALKMYGKPGPKKLVS